MDAQRALLDELMGRNRDGDKPNEEIKDYRDRRVCKKFLCGLCPHDLFQNTKMDLGECAKLHLPKLRDQYEQSSDIASLGYEQELERELLQYISEVEKKIQRAQKRLEEQEGARAPSLMDVENCKEVLEITAEIQEMMQKAEEAGNEGEVDLSMELMAQVEDLKQKKANAQANAMLNSMRPEAEQTGITEPTGSKPEAEVGAKSASIADVLSGNPLASTNVNQKLRVCDVCGAFLSIFDSDRRLADHFGGKLHLGYLQIRKKIEEIKTVREEKRRGSGRVDEVGTKEGEGTGSSATNAEGRDRLSRARGNRSRSRSGARREDRSSHRSRGGSSRRDRSGDRDRDRGRDRDRARDRSRERSRRRRRSRSVSRSKSRSRSRGRRR